MKFNNVKDLKEYIKNSINYALDNNVKEGILETLYDHAVSDVYDAYAPSMYERRYSLLDEGNYEIDKSEDMKISVTPIAEFNPVVYRYKGRKKGFEQGRSANSGNELAGLINYGDGWNGYRYEFVSPDEAENPTYTAPRPFIDYARENLSDGMAKDYLIEGLAEMGIHAE